MYSGWDTYHSLAQLQAMLTPKEAGDQAQSLVNYYAEDGSSSSGATCTWTTT